MAIVKDPLHSTIASGNMGALNYTTWRGRAVVRAVGSYSDPATGKQATIRGYLAAAVTNWRTVLTEANREAWREYAIEIIVIDRLGVKRHPTAYNLYVGMSINAQRVSGPALLDPPLGRPARLSMTFVVEVTGGGTGIRWRRIARFGVGAWDRSEGWFAGPYDSQARHPIEPEWRFNTFELPGAYNSMGTTPGKWYWVRTRFVTLTGLHDTWVTAQKLALT